MTLNPMAVWGSQKSAVLVLSPDITLIEIALGEHWDLVPTLHHLNANLLISKPGLSFHSPFQSKELQLTPSCNCWLVREH